MVLRRLAPNLSSAHLRPRQLLWLLYALFFAAGMGQAMIVPLLPRLAHLYGLSSSDTALLLALPGLTTLGVSIPAGLATDRFGARRVTLAAGALLCLACVAQAAPSLPVLLAGRLAFGVAFGLVWTTGMAWLREIDDNASGARLGPAVTCSSVGVMTGPAVAGLLAQRTGIGVPFLLLAGIAVLVVTPLWLGSAGGDATAAAGSERGSSRAALRSLSTLARRPGVGAAAGGLIVSGAVSGASQLMITLGLHDDGLSTAKIGLAFSAAAIAYILISVVIVRLGERAFTLRVNAVATLILSLALVPALAAEGPGALIIALLLAATARAAISTVAYSLPASATAGTPEGSEGDGIVFGILNGAWAGAMVLTPLLAGAVEQTHGASVGYLVVIVPSCLIAVCLLARAVPRQRVRARVVPS